MIKDKRKKSDKKKKRNHASVEYFGSYRAERIFCRSSEYPNSYASTILGGGSNPWRRECSPARLEYPVPILFWTTNGILMVVSGPGPGYSSRLFAARNGRSVKGRAPLASYHLLRGFLTVGSSQHSYARIAPSRHPRARISSCPDLSTGYPISILGFLVAQDQTKIYAVV